MPASSRLATEVAQRLEEQLARLSFYDVIIEVRGTPFECHRFILSACSQYFREVFSNETGGHFLQVIEISETQPETFSLVRDCVYGAKEDFTVDNVKSIWDAAQHLQIDFLCEACERFQYQRLSKDCCVDIIIHAKKVNAGRLLDKAREIMIKEFDYLRKQDDLLALDFEELKLLVGNDHLEARSEDDVVETILRWTNFHSSDDNPVQDTTVGSTRPNSKVVKNMLPELLKSARVCLVSATFLNSLLDDRCVFKSPAAFEIAREALRYQLQPGRRHDYCPPYAMHRNRSPLQNVTVAVTVDANGTYRMSCRTPDGTWYRITQPALFKVSAVTYDNDLYMVSACSNVQATLRYSTSSNTWVKLTNLSIQRDGSVLVCVDNYVYAVGGTNNKSIDRFDAQEEQRAPDSVTWEQVGDLQWEVTNVMATVFGKYIVVFGKKINSTVTTVQSFNTSTMTTSVYTDSFMGDNTPMVSFKNGKDTFVLQETGDLWKVVNCDNQDLKMEFRGKLFDDKLSLHGAVVFNRELLILATGFNRQMKMNFRTKKIDNVSSVNIIERNGVCLLNTVIARNFLTTQEASTRN
ncbi:unnamed protein product [Lymnaea stagnalis]|uniref:BTB domain-containing protein n=1 Tax=Lymnaea stagnalis TaxID=6523 RepID=A0AAV2H6H6_LYMST